ncbi:MAG TPA: single-stranded-DNA-specific exonuclease RecJ [Rectinema sp.]|jgi:single-stranded-DNA-specific exonuclease|nr:single-stranded-DNA-specific exonuclease RecJ [Treponema sp.]HNP92900.1 single-stranded-DNA-specific exonuclease RecJ [Rectinema sp.]HNT59147.1 single-stranded-DNA-specific exonuclease RecJ [Rectinema sp.]HOE98537.1 single-stranded-DNA-specific exonuclease RecJ [Rectinema sp.]HOU60365.1 single-stranded-DNA-specific exonuclease RecJ [Rectinema sp.]
MKWIKREIDPVQVRGLSQRYEVDTLTASILVRRNITDPEQIQFYLENDLQLLHNPFLFNDMEDAVDRIITAREEEEKVLVFGDSDADGITSTVLMTEALRDFGLEVFQKVPEGEEPYGLSKSTIDFAKEQGVSLIVTVDCGISNHEEVLYASQEGIDVIITDHHRIQTEEPPKAIAILDPKLPDCGYPFRDLSGCGVALKLAHALAIARLGICKEPLALLRAGQAIHQEICPGAGASKLNTEKEANLEIEAIRLDNLLEASRLKITSDNRGYFPSDTLEKLEKFLRGRIVIVWNKNTTEAFFKKNFAGLVELEVIDLEKLAATVWPNMSGNSLEGLVRLSRLKKYAHGAFGAIDALKHIFNAYLLHTLQSQSLLNDRMFQLTAFGTIADLMPLKNENRLIVRRGIESLNTAPTNGIRELKMALNLGKPLGSNDVAWQITPIINAAGRLGRPKLALDLFQAKTAIEATETALQLIQANNERRRLGTEAWGLIQDQLAESVKTSGGKFAIVGSSRIKSGITGLLASRAANIMKIPVIVAVFKTDGICTGSIRGGDAFPLSQILAYCADLFLDYGGHDSAAGFTMKTDNWQAFLERLAQFMARTELITEEPEFLIDAELPHSFVTPDLLQLCRYFEPIGEESDPLVFCSRNVSMVDAQIVGKNGKSHLKLTLDFGRYKWPAMLWDGAKRLERDFSFRDNDKVDIIYKVTTNYWNGEERPQLELYDVHRSESPSL